MPAFLCFALLLLFEGLFAKPLPEFKRADQPAAPDYSDERNWSALPFRTDAADMIPENETWTSDSLKEADVFYIYPTLYAKGKTWNARLDDEKLNKRLDNLPVKYQASIFNQAGRVYAPRYRQAIIDSYFDPTGSGQQALNFAYEDVKTAFQYYLDHYNQGRPVIIASHSQGTTHARNLIRDFFDTPEKKKQLICAYLVGYEVNRESYSVLEPCDEPEQTQCYVAWSTFRHGFEYNDTLHYFGNVCINPVSWRTDTAMATSNGGILLNVDRKKKFTTDARIHQSYLWAKTDLTFMRRRDVLHLVDLNLFWFDVRKNAALRVKSYFDGKP